MALSMSIWIFLMITAIGICGSLRLVIAPKISKERKAVLSRAAKMGFFLFAFDFIFENLGLILGYWNTAGSLFQVGAVPVEVMVIAATAGYAYAMIFPRKFGWETGFFTSLLIAAAGTAIEAMLNGFGVLTYTGGWTSVHALVSYFGTFFLMHKVNSIL